MSNLTTSPTTGASAQELTDRILTELRIMDIESAIHALDEMYSTYIQHCIADNVPAELHDDIFTLHKSLRVILYAQKELGKLKITA